MPTTQDPTASVVPPQTGSGDTVKGAAEKVGFFDNGIPPQLYSLWRTQVHRGIRNWDCVGAAEAGTKKWTDCWEWAAGQPGMAPRGQVEYAREEVKRHVRPLCDDIAKQARNSRQAMWEMIYVAREAYRTEYSEAPEIIEPPKWLLPDVQELGVAATKAAYMPRSAKGKASNTVVRATAESNFERNRRAARDRA